MHHFSKRTIVRLAKKGITVLGLTSIPGEGAMPWANSSTGYNIDDNGTHRVLAFNEVLALTKG